MQAVGIGELKNKLSHYLRLAEAGESVLVTDRGRVVAELCPPGSSHDPTLSGARSAALPDGAAADLLDAERGSL